MASYWPFYHTENFTGYTVPNCMDPKFRNFSQIFHNLPKIGQIEARLAWIKTKISQNQPKFSVFTLMKYRPVYGGPKPFWQIVVPSNFWQKTIWQNIEPLNFRQSYTDQNMMRQKKFYIVWLYSHFCFIDNLYRNQSVFSKIKACSD